MLKSRRLAAPLMKVIPTIKILKFPNLSAKSPAAGGAIMSANGTAVFTSEASSMVKPRDLKNRQGNLKNVNITCNIGNF
jgi:hypothetical protein